MAHGIWFLKEMKNNRYPKLFLFLLEGKSGSFVTDFKCEMKYFEFVTNYFFHENQVGE